MSFISPFSLRNFVVITTKTYTKTMAKKTMEMKVMVDNSDAIRSTKKFGEEIANLTNKLALLGDKLNNKEMWGPNETASTIAKDIEKTQKQLDEATKKYEATVRRIGGIDDLLAKVEGLKYNILTKTRTTLTNSLKNASLETEEDLKEYEERLRRVQIIRDEIAKRDIDVRGGMTESRTKEVMKSIDSSSYIDIKNAIETMKKMQAQLDPNSNKWKTYGKQIADATNYLKKWDDQAKRTQMLQATKGDLGKMSDSDLQQQLRYWDGIVNGVGRTNVAVTQYRKILDTLRTEQDKRVGRVMTKVEGDDFGGNIAEMQQRLKLLQDYRAIIDSTKPDAYIRVDAAIDKLTQKIKESQAGFLSYADAMKQAEGLADGSFKGSISDLDKMKKVLEEYKGTISTTDTDGLEKVNTALGNIEQKQKELQSGYISYSQAMIAAAQVMNGSFDGSLADLEKLQKVLTEYRNSLDVKDTDGLKDVDTRLEAITKKMQDLRPGFMSFQDALNKAKQVGAGTFDGTLEDLDKIQKTLKEGMDSELSLIDPNDLQLMKEAQASLDEIAKKRKEVAQIRLKEQAESTLTDIDNDNWDKTIGETQEAIKQLKEYRNLLDIDDLDGLKRVDDAIDLLTQKTKAAEKGFISLNDALDAANQVASGTYKGTIKDLENLKKSLEELRKKDIEIGNKDRLKDVDKAIFAVQSRLNDTTQEAVSLDWVINNISDANFNQLEMAAKALTEELKNMSESADGYAEKAADLRDVEAQMKKLKSQWESHYNVIMKTAKRLMAYVAVYGGFNEILSTMKELIGLNLKLSDSMADVQKTTGLAGVELQELGKDIERIDSRTSTDKLYEIAAAAGQIGLKTQEDVLGFTKAANTITVALNELGTEGAANLMKIATLTGEVASYGTENALMRVGSAINELTASSSATAGPITDFIGRVGGIASASKITIAEMAALGAVTDASAQSVEIAGTSMNKFISALMSNTENIAYAANISVNELQELIDNGQTMGAVVRVLESMQTMSRGAQSALLKELGSEGARMNQYVAALVANLDMLKGQLAISRRAFEENVSVINEYNVKQESAAGILERMKNSFKDAFVNSRAAVGMVTVLENISKLTSKIVDLLSDSLLTTIMTKILTWSAKLLAMIAEFKPALIALEAIIIRLSLLKSWIWIVSFGTSLSNVLTIVKTAVGSVFVSLRNALVGIHLSFVTASAGASGFSAVLSGLKGVISGLWATIAANPLGVIATIAGIVISLFHNLGEEVDSLIDSLAELNQKHTREVQELNALRAALESTNTSYGVKAAALEKLNSLYSKYLGFQLSEIDSYGKKAAALDLVNTKLKEQQALEEKKRRQDYVNEQFSANSKEYLKTIEQALAEIPEIGRARWYEAIEQIHKAVQEGVTDSHELYERLKNYFEFSRLDVSFNEPTGKFLHAAQGYAKEYKAYIDNLNAIDNTHSQRTIDLKREEYEQTKKLAQAHQADIEAIELAHQEKVQQAEAEGRKISEQEQIAYLQALKRENEQYLETAKKMQEHWKAADETKLGESMITGDDGKVTPGMVGTLYGPAAAAEAEEYNKLLQKRNDIEKEYLGMAGKIKSAQETVNAIEAQREENWDTPEEEDKYLANLNAAITYTESLKAERDKLYKEMKAADKLANEQFGELSLKAASDSRKAWTAAVEEITAEIESLSIRIAGDPYGKGFNVKSWKDFGTVIENLDTSSVDALAAAYKKLRDESMNITADVESFNRMFNPKTPKKNLDELNEQVLDWANQIRQELESRGRGVTGEFLFGEGKEGYEQVLKQLETHFTKEQEALRNSYLKGMISGPELKRRLDENNKEFLNARIELNKLMLGESNKFDQSLYPELAEANILQIARTIFTAGEEVRAEIEHNLAEDKNTLTENAIKIREDFEKEVTKINPFGDLNTKFRDMLDSMNLMSSEWERNTVEVLAKTSTEVNRLSGQVNQVYDPYKLMSLDKESQDKRFKLIRDFSAKSYTVDSDGLKKMMKAHEGYYDWIANLSKTELENLLQASRWYYDQELLALKSRTSEIKKMVETAFNQSELDYSGSQKYDWMIQNVEDRMEGIKKVYQEREGTNTTSYLNDQDYRAHKIQLEEYQRLRDEARAKEAEKAKRHRETQKRKAKEDMEASISALQAYYNEQEAMIRKNALEQGASQVTLDRQLMNNTIKREQDLKQLRKKLLGDESTFDPNANEGYKGVITGTEFFGKNKTNEVLNKQAQQIETWGKHLQDGIRNQIAKGEITIQEALKKERDKIEKVLLNDDFNAKVAEEYLESIDTLGLLFNIETESLADMDKQTGEARLAYMREWSKESYSLTAKDLQDKMEANAIFGDWVKKRTSEDYEALLIQLRKFHDDQEEADRKSAERRKKIFDNSKEGRALSEQEKKEVGDRENDAEMWDRFQGLDLVTENTTDEAQIAIYQAKIDASNRYIEQIKLEMQAEIDRAKANVLAQQATLQALEMMGASTDEQQARLKQAQLELASIMNQMEIMIAGENESILENQQQISDRYTAMQQRKVEEYKKYSDAVVDWSAKMTEAEWDDVESRKEATEEMVRTLLSYLRDWAAAKLTELTMKAMFSEQSTMIEGGETQKSLTMQGAKAGASVALSGVEGTGKEVAKHGLKGLLIGAAITAALTALMNVAMKTLFKSKAEVASASGVGAGRLATGMLTYAEGNYPVLGNDGNVYNAKYEGAGMKTGIYGGGAHFGIFSEKKPEAIIDGDTTQRLILNHPDIWQSIVTLSKTGRLDRGMRTFASGNINELARTAQEADATATAQNNDQMLQMQATLDRNSQIMLQLTQVLSQGIHAKIDMYGDGGMYKSMKKAESFASKRGYR